MSDKKDFQTILLKTFECVHLAIQSQKILLISKGTSLNICKRLCYDPY